MRITPVAFRRRIFGATLSLGLASSLSQAVDGPLTPEEALKTFKLEPNLKMELVAAEPTVISPVAIAFDEKGRMYVAEDRGYPVGPGKGKPPEGKIALLEDENGDGLFEKRTTFAEGLTFPNGVMCWKGGVFVTCAPDLFYFKDTNGDGKADVKQVIFKGFQDQSTTQLRESHPTLNLDNWIYLNCGLTAAKVTSPNCPDRKELLVNRVDFRFRPDTCEYEEVSGTGQFGGTFDPLGRRFICSNRNHVQHVVMQARYLRRNPYLAFSEFVQDIPDHGAACKLFPLSHNITTAASHTGYFTSACGVTVYTGNSLPPPYWGNVFTCEPAGNLVHRDILEPSGVTFVAKRAMPTNEFIASPDNWFRPVNLANGPDGALYVCDMYRKTIEHPEYLPEATRKITDFESGKDKGRIWRVASSLKPTPRTRPNFARFTPKNLCLQLENPEGWWRMTAHRLLLESKSAEAVPVLKSMVKAGNSSEAKVHALHLLDTFGELTDEELLQALKDKRGPVRENALLLAEPRLSKNVKLAEGVMALAGDSDPRVRFQCALTMGETPAAKTHSNQPAGNLVPALAKIAVHDASDRWTRAAVLSSMTHYPTEFLDEVIQSIHRQMKGRSLSGDYLVPMMNDLGKVMGANPNQDTRAVLNTALKSVEERHAVWQLPLLSGFTDGLRGRTNAASLLSEFLRPDGDANLKQLTVLMEKAGAIASNQEEALDKRLIAINLVGNAESSATIDQLQKLIDPQQPSEVQIAAVRALGRMTDASIGARLVKREHWSAYTQPVKDAVLATILAQPKLLDALFSAIEKGDLPPTSVNPEKRNQLMKHKDKAISERASALFKDLNPGDRMKVYEDYKSVLSLKPDAQSGRQVFAKSCSPCHVFSGEGHAVGPDLTGIRNQPADVLLMHIIVPEFEIMPIYSQYNVELKDGRSVSGILTAETPASVTIKQALGVEEKIQRSNIASMASSSLSIMPQELEKTMSKQELADLIGFLKGP